MLRRTCELGSHYDAMEKEVISLRLDLDAEKLKSARLEKEKTALGGESFSSVGNCNLFSSLIQVAPPQQMFVARMPTCN